MTSHDSRDRSDSQACGHAEDDNASESCRGAESSTLEPKVWYRGGLKFECRRCGDCCKTSGVVYVRSDEAEKIMRFLGADEQPFRKSFLREVGGLTSLVERDDGACIMLDPDTNLCRIYDVRPRQCSAFPFWPEFLERPYLWGRQSYLCPGMNSGRYWSLEEIKQKMLK